MQQVALPFFSNPLLDVHVGPLLLTQVGDVEHLFVIFIVVALVQLLVQRPELGRAHAKVVMRLGLVPENLVFDAVALGIVVDHQALEVLSTSIHCRAKNLESWKHACIVLVNALAIIEEIFAQDKDVINVCT